MHADIYSWLVFLSLACPREGGWALHATISKRETAVTIETKGGCNEASTVESLAGGVAESKEDCYGATDKGTNTKNGDIYLCAVLIFSLWIWCCSTRRPRQPGPPPPGGPWPGPGAGPCVGPVKRSTSRTWKRSTCRTWKRSTCRTCEEVHMQDLEEVHVQDLWRGPRAGPGVGPHAGPGRGPCAGHGAGPRVEPGLLDSTNHISSKSIDSHLCACTVERYE